MYLWFVQFIANVYIMPNTNLGDETLLISLYNSLK